MYPIPNAAPLRKNSSSQNMDTPITQHDYPNLKKELQWFNSKNIKMVRPPSYKPSALHIKALYYQLTHIESDESTPGLSEKTKTLPYVFHLLPPKPNIESITTDSKHTHVYMSEKISGATFDAIPTDLNQILGEENHLTKWAEERNITFSYAEGSKPPATTQITGALKALQKAHDTFPELKRWKQPLAIKFYQGGNNTEGGEYDPNYPGVIFIKNNIFDQKLTIATLHEYGHLTQHELVGELNVINNFSKHHNNDEFAISAYAHIPNEFGNDEEWAESFRNIVLYGDTYQEGPYKDIFIRQTKATWESRNKTLVELINNALKKT
jgi:hypothetical protein